MKAWGEDRLSGVPAWREPQTCQRGKPEKERWIYTRGVFDRGGVLLKKEMKCLGGPHEGPLLQKQPVLFSLTFCLSVYISCFSSLSLLLSVCLCLPPPSFSLPLLSFFLGVMEGVMTVRYVIELSTRQWWSVLANSLWSVLRSVRTTNYLISTMKN